jgi:Fibronectin type III domain
MRLRLDTSEQRITLGETAEFELTVDETGAFPEPDDFQLTSDNPRFNHRWARIAAAAQREDGARKYRLQIRPAHGDFRAYGRYHLEVEVRPRSGGDSSATANCLLIVRPCVRVADPPHLKASGGSNFTLEVPLINCSGVELDVTVSVKRHNTDDGQSWSFELEAGGEPFLVSYQVAELRGHVAWSDHFDLDITADGVEVLDKPIDLLVDEASVSKPARPKLAKLAAGAVGAAVLAVVAIVAALHSASSSPPPTSVATTIPTSSAPPPTTRASSTTVPTTTLLPTPSLSASPGVGAVALTWSASSGDSGAHVTGYDIYDGTKRGGESSAPVNSAPVQATSYQVTGLQPGTTYYFVVSALGADGRTAHSNEASAMPKPGAPGPPISLTGTAGTIEDNPYSTTLSWIAPSSNGGKALIGYDVYKGTTSGSEPNVPVNSGPVQPPTTSYQVTGLQPGTTYYFM